MFPGGTEGLAKFLRTNIRYPRQAKESGVSGKVLVKFNIEEDGNLTDMQILRDPGTGLGDEAVRVMKLSPKWTPAIKDGQNISTEFTLPINFSLSDNDPKDVSALYNTIRTKIKYPQEAKDKNIQGRTFVSFTVNDNKQMENFKILRTADQSMGDEVVRVLQNFRIFIDGKPGLTYTLPVYFMIDAIKNQQTPSYYQSSILDNKPNDKNQVTLNEVVVTTYK